MILISEWNERDIGVKHNYIHTFMVLPGRGIVNFNESIVTKLSV